jgi:membrane protein DedA with SNARE-associated domain
MMLQHFLQEFGYFALFLGTFFEGETILVLAGFLAFRGYMDINLVVVVAFFGSYAGDQLWYFMGRKHGRKLLARKPSAGNCSVIARWNTSGRHPDIWVLSFRFVYGLRTVMPVAIGLSGYPPGRYLLLNGIGAAVWAAALGAAAFKFGAVLEGLLGNVKKVRALGAWCALAGHWWAALDPAPYQECAPRPRGQAGRGDHCGSSHCRGQEPARRVKCAHERSTQRLRSTGCRPATTDPPQQR